jgi:hypothetical protein
MSPVNQKPTFLHRTRHVCFGSLADIRAATRPVRGCVAGVPCWALRTCRVALRKSTCSQRRSISSDARRPCLKAIRSMVESRWPWRLPAAAFMRRSTSASVRCSRVLYSALGLRISATVHVSCVGNSAFRCDCVCIFHLFDSILSGDRLRIVLCRIRCCEAMSARPPGVRGSAFEPLMRVEGTHLLDHNLAHLQIRLL